MTTNAQTTPTTSEGSVQQVQIVDTPKPSVEERITSLLDFEDQPGQPEPEKIGAEPPEDDENDAADINNVEADSEEEKQDTEQEEDSDSDSEDGESSEEEILLDSLADLAEHLGVEPADLYGIKIPINTPSGRKDVSLGEWKDEVQKEFADREAQHTASTQKAEQEIAYRRQLMQQQLNEAMHLSNVVERQLIGEINGVNWEALRQDDPAEYAAMRQQYGERVEALKQFKSQMQQSWTQQQQAQYQQHAQHLEQLKAREQQELFNKIPEWSNREKAVAEAQGISRYLLEQGFAEQEASNILDHRFVVLARKAMKFDELNQANPAKKKVVKVGKKTVKPGSTKTKTERADSQRTADKKRAKQAGTTDALAAYFEKHILD